MKKIATVIVCVLCLLGLCACGGQESESADSFHVEIALDSDTAIYGIHYEYYLDGEALGGATAGRADGAALDTDEPVSPEFIAADFPADADLSGFEIEFFVTYANGAEDAVAGRLAIDAAYGQTYGVTISGNSTAGFTAQYDG